MKARRVWVIVACLALVVSTGLAHAQEPVTDSTAAALADHVIGDIDSDGRTDLAVYGTNSGDWWILKSGSNYATYFYRAGWGGTGWTPVSGDFDGDALMDLAVYSGDSGDWWILTSLSGYTDYIYRGGWGGAGYVPVGGAGGPSWLLAGNKGTNPSSNYIGTNDNQALEFKVNGERALRLEPIGSSPNVIGGSSGNGVTPGVRGATIAGGGVGGAENFVTADYGTVGGGYRNMASGPKSTVSGGYYSGASGTSATVSGGESNTASGDFASVGGGQVNTASGDSATVSGGYSNTVTYAYATVSGGYSNTVTNENASVVGGKWNTASGGDAFVGGGIGNKGSGPRGTVGGGYYNTASGNASTVPGGADNIASGGWSFAAGNKAQATHDGAFVWSSAAEQTLSWGNNTFTARAHGGARFYSASGTGTGVQLSFAGSSWGSISDREAKENFSPLDSAHLLQTLATMPVQTWNLRAQDAAIRHIGPVAQDFNGQFAYLFGQVEDPLYINTMDAVGVSLAGVQGLYEQLQQQAGRIDTLEAENAALQQQLADLSARMAALEAALAH